MEWKRWNDAWPDWRDVGRRVEVEENGTIVAGKLTAEEMTFNGEDEVPIFMVKTEDGRDVSFSSNDRWRFMD